MSSSSRSKISSPDKMACRTKHITTYVILLLVAAVSFYLLDQFRTRHIKVSVQMTWKCTTHAPDFPGPVVLLRFNQAPEYGIFQADRTGSFCRLVSQNGAPTVTIISDVFGTKSGGLVGWQEEQINGHPYPINSEFAGARQEGPSAHPFPYAIAFDRAIHRKGN